MIKRVMFGVLALTASVFADDDLIAATQKKNNSAGQRMKNQDQNMMMNVVTLTSARPESENGWYIFADALYWHADIGSTDWAVVHHETIDPAVITNVNHSLDFKWNWGFRVGIGANIDHDMWDTNFYYTWFFTKNSNSAGKENANVIDQMGTSNAPSLPSSLLSRGSIKWDLHFSMFDWELGRWHYVSRSLALRPHVGIKGGWINQDIHADFSGTAIVLEESANTTFHEKFENNYWGVGPSVGVNTLWVLGSAGKMMDHRFSFFGDFGGALMYGHFEVENKQTITATGAGTGNQSFSGLDRNLATVMLQGIMGLSWDTAFNQGKSHFMMKLGYEFQYWFRQNQLIWTFPGTRSDSVSHRFSDDLALQGLTAEIRFDF